MLTRLPQSLNTYRILWTLGLFLGIAAFLLDPGDPFARWALGAGLILVYLIFTGKQKASAEAISVGQMIPSFTATDSEERKFDSSTLLGKRVLLKFFRGHW